MSEDLRAKLKQEIGPVLWSDLRAHAVRQGLFLLSPEIALLDAAYAIATDNASQVEDWIATGHLRRPTRTQLDAWDETLDKPFESVVVQPFALVQEQGADAVKQAKN